MRTARVGATRPGADLHGEVRGSERRGRARTCTARCAARSDAAGRGLARRGARLGATRLPPTLPRLVDGAPCSLPLRAPRARQGRAPRPPGGAHRAFRAHCRRSRGVTPFHACFRPQARAWRPFQALSAYFRPQARAWRPFKRFTPVFAPKPALRRKARRRRKSRPRRNPALRGARSVDHKRENRRAAPGRTAVVGVKRLAYLAALRFFATKSQLMSLSQKTSRNVARLFRWSR